VRVGSRVWKRQSRPWQQPRPGPLGGGGRRAPPTGAVGGARRLFRQQLMPLVGAVGGPPRVG